MSGEAHTKAKSWRPLVSTYVPERSVTVVTRGMTSVEIPDRVVLMGPPGYVGWDKLLPAQMDRVIYNYAIALLDEADARGQEEEGHSQGT